MMPRQEWNRLVRIAKDPNTPEQIRYEANNRMRRAQKSMMRLRSWGARHKDTII